MWVAGGGRRPPAAAPMPRRTVVPRKPQTAPDPNNERDRQDYATLDLLDRLEELLEEMDELGVAGRDDVERRIAELEAQLADVPDEET